MHPSDQLISNTYNFISLSQPDQVNVIFDLVQNFNQNTTLKWPPHRQDYVVPLCKELANLPMTSSEITQMHDIRRRFKSISCVSDLDTCLMFWQITKDRQYWNYIHNITTDPNHELFSHASIILLNE